MDKVIRNGQVAILYSPGYGAGWYTWNSSHPECIYDPEIVAAVEAGDTDKAASIATEKFGEYFYTGGADDLVIEWIPEGSAFEINEYDGNETVHVIGDRNYLTA